MKKLLFAVVVAVLSMAGVAKADTFSSPIWDLINNNLSSLNVTEGGFYAVREHQAKDLTSLTFAEYQNPKYSWLKLDGDLGYAPGTALALEPMIPLGNLSQFGITIPIVSQININVGYAFAYLYDVSGTRKTDDGPAVTGSYTFKF